ncbi:hypothetical protein HPB51_005954 [Rhipicephalus microplus]|uniref:Uncharacterized protein n=1 Tax=Rhipicephalus microplus TaxID=6941 RepID=A0A9J6E776_RHIMP|nr:hypothetical protein HPB51_005954 [Rhipicephalus microplus]
MQPPQLGFFHGFFCDGAASSSMVTFLRHVEPADIVPPDCPVTRLGDGHGVFCGFSIGLPRAELLIEAIVVQPITGHLRTATSTWETIKDIPSAHSFSGQNSGDAGTMPNHCLFFVQVSYIQHAYSYRSDDRFLLLTFCPSSLVDFCFRMLHCYDDLLLSGDVELNPGV